MSVVSTSPLHTFHLVPVCFLPGGRLCLSRTNDPLVLIRRGPALAQSCYLVITSIWCCYARRWQPPSWRRICSICLIDSTNQQPATKAAFTIRNRSNHLTSELYDSVASDERLRTERFRVNRTKKWLKSSV